MTRLELARKATLAELWPALALDRGAYLAACHWAVSPYPAEAWAAIVREPELLVFAVTTDGGPGVVVLRGADDTAAVADVLTLLPVGIAPEACRSVVSAVVDVAFGKGFHKVEWRVQGDRTAELAAGDDLGFTRELSYEQACLGRAGYEDLVLLGLLRHEWGPEP